MDKKKIKNVQLGSLQNKNALKAKAIISVTFSSSPFWFLYL